MPIYRHFAVPFFASWDALETFSDWTLWRIFPCYFSKALPYWRRQKMNPNIQKIDILCNVTNKKFARHFENHRCMTWRHTGSDQWTNVYPRDGPSLLVNNLLLGSRQASGVCSRPNPHTLHTFTSLLINVLKQGDFIYIFKSGSIVFRVFWIVISIANTRFDMLIPAL